MVGDNKYIMAECQQGIQLKGRPVIRTSRYSLVITNQQFPVYAKCKIASETRAGNPWPVTAFVPAQPNDFEYTCTGGH